MALKATVELRTLDIVRSILDAAAKERNIDYMRDGVLLAIERLDELPGATYCATCGEPKSRATFLCSACRFDAEVAQADNEEMERQKAEGTFSWPPAR